MTYPMIKNPEFIDLQKTKVRMTLVHENGTESIAELSVPANKERGVNPYWDRIMDEFDIEEMRKRRNDAEIKMRKEQEFHAKKRKAADEGEKLRRLFDIKMQAFNLPFISESSDEDKASVRRAPNEMMLSIVISHLANKYVKENNMTFIDLFDLMDDLEDERAEAAAAQSTETPNLVQ